MSLQSWVTQTKQSDGFITLRSLGCYSCSCVCSAPGLAAEASREVFSSQAASSASRSPHAASWLAPAVCRNKKKTNKKNSCHHRSSNYKIETSVIRLLTWWGFGRRIRPSTALWRRPRDARWWSDQGGGDPACFCPDKTSSPVSTTEKQPFWNSLLLAIKKKNR